MKRLSYVILVSRDQHGNLTRVPLPMRWVYAFASVAVVGMFTVVGLAGSYSRMLLKTEHFNQVRQERDRLRQDYGALQKQEREKEVQAASLGALASEVSALYGFTAERIGGLTRSHVSANATAQVGSAAVETSFTNANYYKSLDAFYSLRTQAIAGLPAPRDAARIGVVSLDPLEAALRTTTGLPTLWPVLGPITSPFGEREDPVLGNGEGEFHKGVDIAAPLGTPIRATADGIVVSAGMSNGYGREVVLDNGGGVKTIFGHMSGLHCSAGQRVLRGEVIGYVGHSGRTTGNHVHYEVRVRDVAVNPHKYLRQTIDQPSVSSGM